MTAVIENRRIQFGDIHKYNPFDQADQANNANVENIVLKQIAIINEILSLRSKLSMQNADKNILFDNLTKLQKL